MKTMKYLVVIALSGTLLFGCSAKTADKEKKEPAKTEVKKNQNQTATGQTTVGKNTTVINAADGDTRFADGLSACSPLFTQTNDIFSQSATVNGSKTTYDYDLIKQGVAKSKEATQCVDTHMGGLGIDVPVSYTKTLDKFANTTSEMLAAQKLMEKFLQSKNESDYSNAIEHLINMSTDLSETSTLFQQEQK